MKFSVTFRNVDSSDALKAYAEERLARIKKYFPDPMSCHVVMGVEGHAHRVDVNAMLHNGFQIAAHEETENMYSSLDMVAAKIERQVRRYKDKLRAHSNRSLNSIPIVHSVFGESSELDSGNEPSAALPAVKREQLVAEEMSVADAVMQMNLLHQSFFVFRHKDGGHVCVLYRREGEEYGLLETSSSTGD